MENETKLSTSFEVRDRVRDYCQRHGLKQFWWVNHVISQKLDELESLEKGIPIKFGVFSGKDMSEENSLEDFYGRKKS